MQKTGYMARNKDAAPQMYRCSVGSLFCASTRELPLALLPRIQPASTNSVSTASCFVLLTVTSATAVPNPTDR